MLLDTCTFLWLVFDADRLTGTVRDAFREPTNDVYLSTVSAWEMAVKYSLGKLPLPEVPSDFVPAQRDAHEIQSLPLGEDAALMVSRLPRLHRDPFDRMLISQSLVGQMTLLTPDPAIRAYPVNTLW